MGGKPKIAGSAMSIDISKLHSGTVGTARAGKQNGDVKVKPNTGDTSQVSAQDDTVSLTSTGTTMQALEDKVSDAPVVNQERIDAIRDALQKGEYPFNPERIAEKMIDMERLLG